MTGVECGSRLRFSAHLITRPCRRWRISLAPLPQSRAGPPPRRRFRHHRAADLGLARLDARAAAAGEAIRQGLIARMAFAEAACWLAYAHAWVHPLNLCLCELGLAGSTALTATGSGRKVLPHTFAATSRSDWDDPPFDAMAAGDRIVADALALARLLRRLPGSGVKTRFGSAIAAAETLDALGAGWLDPTAFTASRTRHTPATGHKNRGGGGGEGGAPPPLLTAVQVAAGWMEAGISARPAPRVALFVAAALLARSSQARAVFVPVWAAYPAAGFGGRDALPTLRADAAARCARRAVAHTGTHAEGARRAPEGGATDRDGVAAGVGGAGGC